MNTEISEDRQSNPLQAAKRAVRRYARDPSETNAEQVSRAWRRIRDLTAAVSERQAWLRPVRPDARADRD